MSWDSDSIMGRLILVVAGLTLVGGLFIATLPWTIRWILRIVLAPRYRIRTVGLDRIPRQGPAVLVLNHVSWIDGFILAATSPRPGKVLVAAQYINLPILRSLAIRSGMIPVPTQGPKGHRAVLSAAQAALDRGELLALFPEAQISRTGVPGTLYRGIELIMSGREDVPVFPAYLDNLWGSVFSFSGGRFFKKWPKGWRRTIGLAVGPPVPAPLRVAPLRQAMIEAGVVAFEFRPESDRHRLPETIDLQLPHWRHPELGLLTASAPDYERGLIRQTGNKPGSVGQAVPGIVIRAVDSDGQVLYGEVGELEARIAGHPGWIRTGARGHVDRDGFVFLNEPGS